MSSRFANKGTVLITVTRCSADVTASPYHLWHGRRRAAASAWCRRWHCSSFGKPPVSHTPCARVQCGASTAPSFPHVIRTPQRMACLHFAAVVQLVVPRSVRLGRQRGVLHSGEPAIPPHQSLLRNCLTTSPAVCFSLHVGPMCVHNNSPHCRGWLSSVCLCA